LIKIPIAGMMTVKAQVHGPFDHPKIAGDISVTNFMFGGFNVGDIESSKVAFEPLVLDFIDARVKHGSSRIRSPLARIAFDKGADVLVDADVDTRDAPHLTVHDFFEVFKFDKDPRFADISGLASGKAHVHYAMGGKEDHCGGGYLLVKTQMDVTNIALFG